LAYAGHAEMDPKQALAMLLEANEPSAAFNPAASGVHSAPIKPVAHSRSSVSPTMSTNADSTGLQGPKTNRRAALAALPAMLTPLMASARDPLVDTKTKLFPGAVRFYDRTPDIPLAFIEGKFVDEAFPGLLRKVEIDPPTRTVFITGKDKNTDIFEWKVPAKTTNGYDLIADFSSRGGPRVVNMTWDGAGWNFTKGTGNGPFWMEYRIYEEFAEERIVCEKNLSKGLPCREAMDGWFRNMETNPFGVDLESAR